MYNPYDYGGNCMKCPEHLRSSERKDGCVPYEGYDFNGTLMFIDELNSIDISNGINSDREFIGPVKFGSNIFYISPLTARKMVSTVYEYREDEDEESDDKANIYMLESKVVPSQGFDERHERLLRVVGSGIEKMDFSDYVKSGKVTVSYEEGDICSSESAEYYSAKVVLGCNINEAIPKVTKVDNKANACEYTFYVEASQICKICTQSDIARQWASKCNENTRLYQYIIKNESQCLVYFPQFDYNLEVNSFNVAYPIDLDTVYDDYNKKYIFQDSSYEFCREVEIGYIIYLTFLLVGLVCAICLVIALLCARRYRRLLYEKINTKERSDAMPKEEAKKEEAKKEEAKLNEESPSNN
jgi:hypothetical protein